MENELTLTTASDLDTGSTVQVVNPFGAGDILLTVEICWISPEGLSFRGWHNGIAIDLGPVPADTPVLARW